MYLVLYKYAWFILGQKRLLVLAYLYGHPHIIEIKDSQNYSFTFAMTTLFLC